MSDLIVFGEDWGAHPSSTQHLVRRLARTRKVLWVNSIGLRRPRLTAHDVKRCVQKLVRAGGRARNAAPAPVAPFPVVNPLVIPLPGSALAQRLNGALVAARLRGPVAAAGMRRPILWASLPTALAAAGKLGERAVVYYCGDDFGALDGVDHADVLKLEVRMAQKADLIFAASEDLARRFPSDRTRHLPHGVDFDLFATPVAPAPDLPLNTPTAGYYGSLSAWIDVEALSAAALALPDWRFVLIGPIRTNVSALMRHSNILFLGSRPHAALPSYAQHWTVSLMPFRDTPQIRACNPLKLREYLAAGRPVVSAIDFPALAPYRSSLIIAKTPAHLADAILEAAEDCDGTTIRRASVEGESWDARAATVAQALSQL